MLIPGDREDDHRLSDVEVVMDARQCEAVGVLEGMPVTVAQK
jgi:hypothetical protein